MEPTLQQQRHLLVPAGATQLLVSAPSAALACDGSGRDSDASLRGLSPQLEQQLWSQQAAGHSAGDGAACGSAGWHLAAPQHAWQPAGGAGPGEPLAAYGRDPWESSSAGGYAPAAGSMGAQHPWQPQQLQPPPPLPRASLPPRHAAAQSAYLDQGCPQEDAHNQQAWQATVAGLGLSDLPGRLPASAGPDQLALDLRPALSNTPGSAQLAREWQGAASPASGRDPVLAWQQCEQYGQRQQQPGAHPAASYCPDPSGYLAQALVPAGQARHGQGSAALDPQRSRTVQALPSGGGDYLLGASMAGRSANHLPLLTALPSQPGAARAQPQCQVPQQQLQGRTGSNGALAAGAGDWLGLMQQHAQQAQQQQAQKAQLQTQHRQPRWQQAQQQHHHHHHDNHQQHPGQQAPPPAPPPPPQQHHHHHHQHRRQQQQQVEVADLLSQREPDAWYRLICQLDQMALPAALAPALAVWQQHQHQPLQRQHEPRQQQQPQAVGATRWAGAGPAGVAAASAPAPSHAPSPAPSLLAHGASDLSALFSQLDSESQQELLQLGEDLLLPGEVLAQAAPGQPPMQQQSLQRAVQQQQQRTRPPPLAHCQLGSPSAQQHPVVAEVQMSTGWQQGVQAALHASLGHAPGLLHQHFQQQWAQPAAQPQQQQPARHTQLAAAQPDAALDAPAAACAWPGRQRRQGQQHQAQTAPAQQRQYHHHPQQHHHYHIPHPHQQQQLQQQLQHDRHHHQRHHHHHHHQQQQQQQQQQQVGPSPLEVPASQPPLWQPDPAIAQPATANAAAGGAAAAAAVATGGAGAASAAGVPPKGLPNRRGQGSRTVAGIWAQKAVRADWHHIQQKRHLQAGVALRAGAAGRARAAYRAEAPNDSEDEAEQAEEQATGSSQQAQQQAREQQHLPGFEAQAQQAQQQAPAQRFPEPAPRQAPPQTAQQAPAPAQQGQQEPVRRSSRGRVEKRCWSPGLPTPTKRRRRHGGAQVPTDGHDQPLLGSGPAACAAAPAGPACSPLQEAAHPLSSTDRTELQRLAAQIAAEAFLAGGAPASAAASQPAAPDGSAAPAAAAGSAQWRGELAPAPAPVRKRGRPRRQPQSAAATAVDDGDAQGPSAAAAPSRPAASGGGSGGERCAPSHPPPHRNPVIIDMMIHAGLLGAARACEVPAAASGGTVGPPLSTSRGTPDDLQSCMLGPAVTLAAPAQAAAASAGSMLAGASTGDMQRRMGAAGVGAFDQRVVLAALGRAPDGRPAAPAPKDSTQQWQRAQHPQQQRVQQQAGSQVGSLGSRPPEEPASPEQRAQPTLPPSSSDDHAEVAPHHAQHPHAHPVAAAAAATPRRRDAPPGTAGKRRSATAGRKQTPGLAATVMAAAARPGTCSAAEASEQAVLQPNARPLQQHQQLLQQPQQPELSREQHQQGEALLEQPVLPPEPGPRPQQPQADTCRQISPQQWREYKAALRCWELRKRAREEAEEELTRPRRRRRPPSPDRRPQTMPPVAPGSAAALLRQQHEAFAALAAGRRGRGGGLRRAAAVRGAKRISAIAGGLLGGRRRGVGSSEEEEVEHPADMDSLRASAPHLIQLRSALHGWGMFAGEPIRRNSFVIEYVGEVVPNAVADRREARYEAEGLGSMYLFRLDRGRVVDATKAGNCARFINHSCEPNCYTAILVDIRSGERSIGIFAKCDIAQGEELTYHYMVEEEPDGEPMPCHCGARSCTGRMN